MFKASRYNFRISDPRSGALWFNSATGHALSLSPAEHERVEGWIQDPELFRTAFAAQAAPGGDLTLPSRVLGAGLFVDQDVDERAQQLGRLATERLQTDHLGLTLSLTSDCNLACSYCVINTTQRQGGMVPQVQEALLAWWRHQLVGRKTCSLEWMGGEPLLYPETLLSLGTRLIEAAAEAGVRVTEQTIITNGTRLTPELALALQRLGVSRLQITLDGSAEMHEQRRPALDGTPTFARILDGLKCAAERFEVRIRVNLARENDRGYPALLQRLADEGLSGRVQVYPARVFEPEARSTCGLSSHCTLTPQSFGALSTAFALEAMERGFRSPGLPRPAFGGFCGAYHQSYFVVGPDGLLYRCPARVGQRDPGAVGTVFDLHPTERMCETQQYYDGLGPTRDKGCMTCKLLPVCLGGCPEESVITGETLAECTPWRFKLKHHLVIEDEVRRSATLEV